MTDRAPITIVTGMHRSGTSLTANLLRQCGLWLGPEATLHGATTSNLDGHWESIKVTELNDSLLNELGGGWDDVPNFPERWPERLPAHRNRAAEIHASLARPGPWGWKDPRASLLMPFWLALVPDARIVICLRHPLEVAHSLRQRGLMSYSLGLKLWRAYNERLLEDVPYPQRLIIHYEHFFTRPFKTLETLVEFCGLKPLNPDINSVITTAKPELRHARFDSELLARTSVAPPIVSLYAKLCDEARFADAPKAPPNGAKIEKPIDVEALSYELFLQRWNQFVRHHTPAHACVAVVSSGDEGLLQFDEREPWHFPRDEQGQYIGYHPSNDAEALDRLAAACEVGAQFLALPQSAFWWLEAYPGFASHLRAQHRVVMEQDQVGVIFQLLPERRHMGEEAASSSVNLEPNSMRSF